MRARLILVSAAVFLAGAGPAAASTASITSRDDDGEIYYTLNYTAALGEANQVGVTFNDEYSSATLTDPGATITPGESCTAKDAHTATCTIKKTRKDDTVFFFDVHVALEDGNDTNTPIDSTFPNSNIGPDVRIDGGPGDDTLRGPTGNDGSATLVGGPGADHLINGALVIDGDDDGQPSSDVIDNDDGTCGAISYEGRTSPVTIDLVKGIAGADGETDTLKNVCRATGGAGDDTLIAGPKTDFLEGGDGNDTFDSTKGIQGGDMYNDTVPLVGQGGRDTYHCGHGVFEYIADPDTNERIPPGCNIIASHGWSVKPLPVSHTASALKYTLPCPDGNDDGLYLPCTAKLTLTQKGKLVGQAGYTLARDGGMKPLTVALTALGTKLLKKSKLVTATLTSTTNHGKSGTLKWSFRLGDVRD